MSLVCVQCSAVYKRFKSRCAQCGAWQTIVGVESARQRGVPIPLSAVPGGAEYKVIKSGFSAVNEIASRSGGIVRGKTYLLSAEPGCGKSTLSLGISGRIAKSKSMRVVYSTTEEDEGEIKTRAFRLGLDPRSILSAKSMNVEQLCEQVGDADFAVLDSLQGMRDRSGVDPEKIAKYITDQHSHPRNCAWILVGQVIKSGDVAGTEGLQHVVDAVLELTGDPSSSLRSLKASKNRMGPTDRRAFLRMGPHGLEDVPDASSYLLADRLSNAPGSVVAAVVMPDEQTSFLVEVQALTVACGEKEKPTVSCVGYPPSRLKQLRGVLTACVGADLGNRHLYVSVVGGIPVEDIGLDLPVAAAIMSALRSKPLPAKSCLWGEVGLTGEIRACREPEARAREAERAGYAGVISTKGGLKAVLKSVGLR